MGGKSSSKSSSTNNYTTTSTSGTVASEGDNNGVMIAGVNDSTITVTDHGAVKAALEEISKVTDSAFDFGSNAIKANENVLDKAFAFTQTASDAALDVAKNLSLDSDAATARDANRNMMLTAVAMAVALGVIAMKKG